MPWIMYPENYLKTDLSSGVFTATVHNGYTPSDSHATFSDVSATEISAGSGYTGEITVTLTRTVTGRNIQLDVADFEIEGFTGTGDTVIIKKGTGSASDPLVCYYEPNGGSSFTGIGDTGFGTNDDQGDGSESYFYDVDLPAS